MIQTILITALSTQLTYIKPALPTKPQTPQYTFTRVLPEKNYEKPVVQKIVPKKQSIPLPKLQIAIEHNDLLQEPSAGASATPTIAETSFVVPNTSEPTTTPTSQPTAIPSVVIPSLTQATVPITPSYNVSSISGAALTYLGNCEGGMDPTKNTGNGYYGAFQFSYGTWQSLNTGYERADLAPLSVQEAAVRQLLARSSIYTQFPACARSMYEAGLL